MVEVKSLLIIVFVAVMLVMLGSQFVSEGKFKIPSKGEVTPQPFFSIAIIFVAVMLAIGIINKLSQEKVTKKDIFVIVLVCGILAWMYFKIFNPLVLSKMAIVTQSLISP